MLDIIIKKLFIRTSKSKKVFQVRRKENVYFDAEKTALIEKEKATKVVTSLSSYFKNNKGLNLTERGYVSNLDRLNIQ